MKLEANRKATLQPRNVEEATTWGSTVFEQTPYFGLVCMLADAIDTAIKGENTYVVIGTTSNKTAVSVTIKQGVASEPHYADTLATVATDFVGATTR